MRIFDSIINRLTGKRPLPDATRPYDEAEEYRRQVQMRSLIENMIATVHKMHGIRSFGQHRPRLNQLVQRMLQATAQAVANPAYAYAVTLTSAGLEVENAAFDSDLAKPFTDKQALSAVYAARYGKYTKLLANLQPMGYRQGEEFFLGLKASTIETTNSGYTARTAYISYDSTESEAAVRNIINENSHQRVDILAKGLQGENLTTYELTTIGEPDYDEIMRMLAESADTEQIARAELAYNRLCLSPRLTMAEKQPLVKALASALATALRNMGIRHKALFYAGAAAHDDAADTTATARKKECEIEAQRYDGRPTALGTIIENCFNITPAMIGQMAVVAGGRQVERVDNATAIINYDFREAWNAFGDFVAYISYDRRHILIIEAIKTGEKRLNLTLSIPSVFENYSNYENSICLSFPTSAPMSAEEFEELRADISRRHIDLDYVSPEESLLLGHTEGAHLEFARALQADTDEHFGEAIYRYSTAAHLAWKAAEKGEADENDKKLLREAPLRIARIYDAKGFFKTAHGYMESISHTGTTADSDLYAKALYIDNLTRLHDLRAAKLIKHELDKQTNALLDIKSGKDNGEYNRNLYYFLRCSQYNALLHEGSYNEAKSKLAIMLADNDSNMRDFAKAQSFELARLGLTGLTRHTES